MNDDIDLVSAQKELEELTQEVQQEPACSRYRYGNRLLGQKSSGIDECVEVSSYSYFCEIWRHNEDPKHVSKVLGLKIRKWIPFAKCDQCSTIRSQLETTRDGQEKSRLSSLLRKHLQFVARERSSYARRRLRGMYAPKKYMSIILDASDNGEYPLPHGRTKSHLADQAWRLKMHVMGVIVHGVATFAYTCPAHLAQGHNITIQALWESIVRVSKEQALPPVLYIQLDNTTKQCKGRWVKAFCAMLVHHGVFQKIVVSYLPVGHTHEDIDQFFSRIATQLRLNDAYSRIALARAIERSYRKW